MVRLAVLMPRGPNSKTGSVRSVRTSRICVIIAHRIAAAARDARCFAVSDVAICTLFIGRVSRVVKSSKKLLLFKLLPETLDLARSRSSLQVYFSLDLVCVVYVERYM